ncbi:hypothetical protein JCM8097_004595 [Rhodosporidiobolus ruineniae]
MARKAARRPSKAAAPAQDDPPPPPQDSDISTSEHAADISTPPSYPVDPQLFGGGALDPADAVDGEKSHPGEDVAMRDAAPASQLDALPVLDVNGAGSSNGAFAFPAGEGASTVFPPSSSFASLAAAPVASTSQLPPAPAQYSEEQLAAWRTAQVDAKQAELTAIVDRHDDYVRELFHLDRFVTLIGFDPATAKGDRSDVFQSFQANYDLFLNAAPDATAGPSGRRGTRRAAQERKVGALAPNSTPGPADYVTNGGAGGGGRKKDVKGKGRATDSPAPSLDEMALAMEMGSAARGGGKKKATGVKGKKAANGSPAPSSPAIGSPTSTKMKKRPSVASTPSRAASLAPIGPLSAPYVPITLDPNFELPPLKHPIPPLTPRTAKRRKLLAESGVTYTHPTQLPPDAPFDNSLPALLSSFISLNDDEGDLAPPPAEEDLEARAEYELDVLSQVEAIRAEGRELLDPDRTVSEEAKRKKDHHDSLVDHAIHFAGLVAQERKAHVALARKTAKMVMKHFEDIRGKEEREEKEVARNQKAVARWTVREVRKKWKLAVGVVRAKYKEEAKAEAKRLGKQQLDAMLNKSTTMLQAQQAEMAGEEEEDEDDSGSEEEEASEVEEEEEADEEEDEKPVDDSATTVESSPAPTPPTKSKGKGKAKKPNGTAASPSTITAPSSRRRPTRARSRLSVSVTPAESPSSSTADEPEEGGVDFASSAADDARLAAEDAEMAADLEGSDAADEEASEDELGGLAAEADMPIEELLRRSGYAAMMAEERGEEEGEGEEEEEKEGEEGGEEADVASLVDSSAPTPAATADDSAAASPAPPAAELTAEEQEAEAMSEFGSDAGEDERDDEDQRMEAEMEQEEEEGADGNQSDDSEMAGLAEDADLPIEELMRKYGYGGAAPAADAAVEVQGAGEGVDPTKPPLTNGDTASPAPKQEEDEEDEAASPAPNAEEDDEEMADEAEDEEDQEAEEDAGSPAVKQLTLQPPFLLRATLRPYQQAGMEWLASLYAGGVNGILADEMGLGKTIQTISLLAHLACDKGQWGPHLVVVPTSVMLNWEMEFRKFLPGFKLMTYYGTQKERKEKRKGWNAENAFHVCVTSYQLVLADQHIFRRKPWHYMILDEAHHIKNFRSQRWQTLLGFNARHRLLLTGTPLQNNLMELWSLLYFLMPHGLADATGPFADHADFQAWFSNPMERAIETGETMDAETQATVNKLHTILRPYLLRRLKAEVETQMPGKTESIIYCRLSKRQRFLYDDFMSRAQTRETLGSGHFLSIINCLMQLRKVCNHPDLFEVRPVVTSFSMKRSVVTSFEPAELLVRKRLLDEEPLAKMDWSTLTLVKPEQEESTSTFAGQRRLGLDAAASFPSLHKVPIDVDFTNPPPYDTKTIAGWRRFHAWAEHVAAVNRLHRLATVNSRRCRSSVPYFGSNLLHILREPSRQHTLLPSDAPRSPLRDLTTPSLLPTLVHSLEQRATELDDVVSTFSFVTPKVRAHDMARHALPGMSQDDVDDIEEEAPAELLHTAATKLTVAFPDRSLLQYDCGKLQKLDELLRECKAGGHRVLIFTQMTKVLDILEEFLSYQGHRYLRLDGSTKIEQRQALTERFNSNDKILAFISSTRAGGLGINLQGADTVIFYDSDWNPALDRQCQDRAHRIGQTREVRIWRFVTEHTIEENMLKKANQKRKLDQMVIAEGEFTTDYLQKLDWRDYLDEKQLEDLGVDQTEAAEQNGENGGTATQSAAEIRNALAAAEDEEDAAAAKAAVAELDVDKTDFEQAQGGTATFTKDGLVTTAGDGQKEEEEDPLAGTVDGYMINTVEEDWEYFASL